MYAHTTMQQRLPEPSNMGELSERKRRLVEEMSEFTKEGDRVNPTDSQLNLADQLVRVNDDTRYVKIPFGDIVRANTGEGYMDMMATAFDILFRYTVNMLKLKRPRNWHTIKFSNAQFKARADCMIGTRNILNIMGYTQPDTGESGKKSGLIYPNPSHIDLNYIKLIGAELLIAKIEIKLAQEYNRPLNPSSLPGPRNIQLENPNPVPERPPYNLDEMYGSNVNSQYRPPQTSTQFPTQHGSMIPSDRGSAQYTPEYGRNDHSIVDSYRTIPPQSGNCSMDQPPHSFQHPDSHGQSNIPQPSSNQLQGYGAQSGYQYDNQPMDHGNTQRDYRPSQDMILEDLESHSTSFPSQANAPAGLSNASGGNDMSAKLEELKRKKADIWKYFDQDVPTTGSDNNMPNTGSSNNVNPPFTPQPQPTQPRFPSSKPKGLATMPIKILDERPSAGQAPVPKPRKNRLNPAPSIPPPIQEGELHPSNTPNVVASVNQGGPTQRPQVAPRMVRVMMECDNCGFPNHEKSTFCLDCNNPRNERWRKVPMQGGHANKPIPSQEPQVPPQPVETMPVTQANIPLSAAPPNAQYESQAPSNTLAAANNVHYGNQPTPTAQVNNQPTPAAQCYDQPMSATPYSDQATGAAAAAVPGSQNGATGNDSGAGILASGLLPPPIKYTAAQKRMFELEAEKKQQQEQHVEQGGEYQNYMTRNNNYHQETGGINRPTGRACPDVSNDSDSQFYKNLGSQGQYLIHDIKNGLRSKYMLEEIQLASKIGHGYQSHCDFLKREWSTCIERTSFRVEQLGEEFHRKKRMSGNIGKPMKKEIVKVLIEEHGDTEKAAQRCCTNRLNMIQELMNAVGLPQSAAVLALERNGLDMDKAIHDVYRQKMNSNALYAYIWGELEDGGIRQMQNDRVKQMIKENKYSVNYLQRLLMAVYKLPTCGNCDVLIHLVRQFDLTVGACLDVAMMNDKVEAAMQVLRQECPICCEDYMRDEMINMIQCNHAVCKECFVSHFSLVVGEKSIKHFNCPICNEPDMSSETIDMDLYLQMFSGLMQAHMSKEHYDLFTQKITERTLMKDPKFVWCIKCIIGFINDAGRDKVECPNVDCKQQLCFKCKKPWEAAHDGQTCEQFAQWKKDNDPELQAQGLAAYLNEEGIECPACKFKYALAKGGCMHFKCNQCPAEFCSGCGYLFKKDCTKFQSCLKKGLHAHHPRDCLSFLRDESVENLQKLLNDNDVEYDTEPPEGQVMAEAKKEIKALQGQVAEGEEEQPVVPPAAAPVLKCRVMLQKENTDGPPIDEECGDAVESGHAGLCLKHYKEYLVFKINQKGIDPLPIIKEIGPLRAILGRDEVKVPDQQAGEGEEQYTERLREFIKEKLPLEKRDVKNF